MKGPKIREAALLVTRLLPGVCPRSGVKKLDADLAEELLNSLRISAPGPDSPVSFSKINTYATFRPCGQSAASAAARCAG